MQLHRAKLINNDNVTFRNGPFNRFYSHPLNIHQADPVFPDARPFSLVDVSEDPFLMSHDVLETEPDPHATFADFTGDDSSNLHFHLENFAGPLDGCGLAASRLSGQENATWSHIFAAAKVVAINS